MKNFKNILSKIETFLDKVQFMKWLSFLFLIVGIILIFLSFRESGYGDLFNKGIVIGFRGACFLSFGLFILLKNGNKTNVVVDCLFLLLFVLLLFCQFDNYLLRDNIYGIIYDKVFELALFCGGIFCYISEWFCVIFLPVLSFLFIYYETSDNNKTVVNSIGIVSIISYLLMYCLMKTPLWSLHEFQNVSDNLHSMTILYPQSVIANVIFFLFLFCLFYKLIKFIASKIFLVKNDKNLYRNRVLNKKFILFVMLFCFLIEGFLVYNSSVMNYYSSYYSTEQESGSKPVKKFMSNRKVYYSDDYGDEKSYDHYLGPINYWGCIHLGPSWIVHEVKHGGYMCEQNNCLKKMLSIGDEKCKTIFIDYE